MNEELVMLSFSKTQTMVKLIFFPISAFNVPYKGRVMMRTIQTKAGRIIRRAGLMC